MNADDLGWAFLFLVVVGLMVTIGIVVGIIVAGRLDRIQAARPARPAEGTAAVAASDEADGRAQEDETP